MFKTIPVYTNSNSSFLISYHSALCHKLLIECAPLANPSVKNRYNINGFGETIFEDSESNNVLYTHEQKTIILAIEHIFYGRIKSENKCFGRF
jgi:hypothetical protein